MTVFERRNYQVAVLFSIVFHLTLLLIIFPMQLLSVPVTDGVEEVAVGVYELTAPIPQITTVKPELVVRPEKIKQEPKPFQPKSTVPVIAAPETKSGIPDQKPKEFAPPKDPISLGDGTKMVAGFGREPSYPKNAINEEIEGEVLIRLLIKADGALEEVKLLKPSGDARLDKAVINSLNRDWFFKSNPENYYIDISFIFDIKSATVTHKFVNSATRP